MDSFHKSVMMGCCHLSSASLVVKHPKLGNTKRRDTCMCVCVCVRGKISFKYECVLLLVLANVFVLI